MSSLEASRLPPRIFPGDGSRRLLAGPPLGQAESLAAQVQRLGAAPAGRALAGVIDELEASGLLGRGGAGFPVGRKWRAMAGRSRGRAVVLANGAEGEPASLKDRVLMAARPHLVIDGALIAADAVDADEIVFYVGREHEAAVRAMRAALAERSALAGRPGLAGRRVQLVEAPIGYVAGEASGAVHYVNTGDPRPTTTPPRMSERGVRDRPTLVQNVESLAAAALIARFGAGWFRERGREATPGTALVTVSASRAPVVLEIDLGTTVGEVAAAIGLERGGAVAVLAGGYFGTWSAAATSWDLPLDPAVMREAGLTFGCGMVGLLPAGACGVEATARVLGFMARESAGQCGPCKFGLRAIADAAHRLAQGRPDSNDLPNLERWAGVVRGRGACHHPDGAVALLVSALEVFDDDLRAHARTGRCVHGAPAGGRAGASPGATIRRESVA